MSPEERTESARRAARARWGKEEEGVIPRATHEAVVSIGEIAISCAVLDNGMRVLTQEAFLLAIGRSATPYAGTGSVAKGVEELPPFLAAENIKSFVSEELRRSSKPQIFMSLIGRQVL